MPAVAIPLAGLTVVATLIGGWVALRLAHTLPTVIAFTGGVVVAVALFDVLPEGIANVGDPRRRPRSSPSASSPSSSPSARWSCTTATIPPRPRARACRRLRRARPLDPQLHRRARDRPRLRPRQHDRPARLHRRDQPRLRRRPQHRQLRPQPVGRPQAGDKWLGSTPAPLLGAIVGSLLARLRPGPRLHPLLYSGFFIYMGATDLLRGPRPCVLAEKSP